MGNQLVGIAPSQIFPVEHYLQEHSDFKFDSSLGSTRFLKVARAESPEGLIVVKIFAIHDPSLPLQPYKECLENIRTNLFTAINCLPFQKIELTEKAGFLTREYIKFSLYDRISTRPFLTNVEKRWITFQILCALNQCHKVGVCHGDLKLENITVTSWNWVLLVDFASFKPTFLPEDNPADYTYFFDTSRRRVCYIAPERFKKLLTQDSNLLFNENICNSGDLKPSMDIFSAGCALIELWNDGHAVPFEYFQLLSYKDGGYSPQRHLDKIEDPNLRAMLTSMIQLDPSERSSAETYLSQERGNLFPHYFYNFLQPYMFDFSASGANPILSPDEKILRLKKDLPSIIELFSSKTQGGEKSEKDKFEDDKNKDEGLVIIVSLITSTIRGLHDCSSKLSTLEILLELAKHVNEETILDRILPFLMSLAHDSNPRIKVATINTITSCLEFVINVPKSDVNIFPEYILPGLSHLAVDKNLCVRVAYAKNIGRLAHLSSQYLHYIVESSYKNNKDENINLDAELLVLQEMVRRTVSALISDSSSMVKQTLMESNYLSDLCLFFGPQMTNDVLLSHMITFLNDKDDKELRETFFERIFAVTLTLGFHSSVILLPLLSQGLTDSSEFVIGKALNAMYDLTDLKLLTKEYIYDLLKESVVFLMHPSLWIRQYVARFITRVTELFSFTEVNAKVKPMIEKYQKYEIMEIDSPDRLLASLKDPIPRTVYDSVVKFQYVGNLFTVLEKRRESRAAIEFGKLPSSDWFHDTLPATKNLLRRLEEYGMTVEVEEKLFDFRSKLEKINKHKQNGDNRSQNEGKLEISTASVPLKSHVHNLEVRSQKTTYSSSADSSGGQLKSSRSGSPTMEIRASFPSEPSSNYSVHERSYIQYRTSNCNAELRKLTARQQDKYLAAIRSREWAEHAAWESPIPPPGWKLKGSLVAHLHEHKGGISKLLPIPNTPMFASASYDGNIRIWDCSKYEGKNIANRSKQSYRVNDNPPIMGMTVCDEGKSLAACSRDGKIHVLRIDGSTGKVGSGFVKELDKDSDVRAIDIQYLNSGPQSVLVYSTLYGSLVGWDMRSPTEAWRLETGMRQGVVTTFCLDSHQSWVTVGTSSGHHIAWDLRFRLPVTIVQHPSGERVRKVVSHPRKDSWIISSVQCNNEISMWNLENGTREKSLWLSPSPPLTKTTVVDDSIFGLYAGMIDRNGFLLAAGSDQRIRYFDLEDFTNSRIGVFRPNDPFFGAAIQYSERLIDGTSVLVESAKVESKKPAKPEEQHRAGPESPPSGHHNIISDITLCKASQCFLVSGSRDGVIKVWK